MGRTSDADIRLMDAALDLIWEESYGAVTIDDICRRADVKKGSFYYFYKSKAELAVAALERLWETNWQPRLDSQFSPSLDAFTRLTNYLDSIYQRQLEVKAQRGRVLGCPACTVGSEISTVEIEVNGKVRELLNRKRRYFESAIRDAVADGTIEPCDPAEKARALAALIEGLVSQARIMNDPELLKPLRSMGVGLLNPKRQAPATVR